MKYLRTLLCPLRSLWALSSVHLSRRRYQSVWTLKCVRLIPNVLTNDPELKVLMRHWEAVSVLNLRNKRWDPWRSPVKKQYRRKEFMLTLCLPQLCELQPQCTVHFMKRVEMGNSSFRAAPSNVQKVATEDHFLSWQSKLSHRVSTSYGLY